MTTVDAGATGRHTHHDDDVIAVLPMPGGVSLNVEQARRATALALALGLLRGRGVPYVAVCGVARWIYEGDTGELP